jgi:sialate O-acetylesterase
MKSHRVAPLFALALILPVLWTGTTLSARADNRLAGIFQDHMVLQRELPVPIWGWADPGTQVEVDFAGQSKQAKADDKGYWKAILDPLTANATGQDLTAKIGATTVTRKDVLIGEVWISAGHSGTIAEGPNVDTGVNHRYDYDAPAANGSKPEVRFIIISSGASAEPYADLDPLVQGDSNWATLKEQGPKADEMNQTQYLARVIRDKLGVPVGVIQLLCLGTLQQTWMPRETLEALPAESGTGNCYQALFTHSEAGYAKSSGAVKSWDDFKKAEDEWRTTKKGPWFTLSGIGTGIFGYPSVGYNAKVCPLAPLAIRGVQFFACPMTNTGGAEGLAAMVKQWRKLFGQDFYFVNCASGNRVRTIGSPPLAPTIWDNTSEDAIYDSLKLFDGDTRECVVDTKDVGSWNAHNFQRAEAGRRLGLATLSLAYGQPLPADAAGPRMAETKIDGDKATIRFDQVGDGIAYQPSIDGISGIYLLGDSGPGQWGQVNVVGKDTIEVSSPAISKLKTVGYGQGYNTHETLFNSAGLPASEFIVNPPTGAPVPPQPGPQPPSQILTMQGEDRNHVLNNDVTKNAQISLAHVRRSGYVFQIIGQEPLDLAMKPIAQATDLAQSSATTPLVAYIPAEWKGYEVMMGDKYDIKFVGGEPVSKGMVKAGGAMLKTTESTKDGAKFVTFDAPVDGTWVIVAEAGKAADFRKINRY